jgi:hypothetical protein
MGLQKKHPLQLPSCCRRLAVASLPCLPVLRPAVWAAVDLGYSGTVGSIAVAAGKQIPRGTFARFYITGPDILLIDAYACGNEVQLEPGAWVAAPCNATGR